MFLTWNITAHATPNPRSMWRTFPDVWAPRDQHQDLGVKQRETERERAKRSNNASNPGQFASRIHIYMDQEVCHTLKGVNTYMTHSYMQTEL